MDYQPGDVANGHMLGVDGRWYPLAEPRPTNPPPPPPPPPASSADHPEESGPAAPSPAPSEPAPPPTNDGYWRRVRRYWRWSIVGMGSFFTGGVVLANVADPGSVPVDGPLGLFSLFATTGLLTGIPLALLLGTFPIKPR